jgi:hypothetical protein
VDASGNAFVAGLMMGALPLPANTLTAAGTQDTFLLALDPAGKPLWGQSFGGSGVTNVTAVVAGASGEVVIYGDQVGTVSFGGPPVKGPCAYVARFSATGQHLWSRGFGPAVHGRALALEGNGDVVLGGRFAGSVDFGNGLFVAANSGEGFLARLDGATGAAVWSMPVCEDANSECEVRGVAVDGAGNILVGAEFFGKMSFGAGSGLQSAIQSIGLAKLAGDGTPIWERQVTGSGAGYVTGVSVDGAGAAVVAGTLKKGAFDFGDGNSVMVGANNGFYVARFGADNSYGWSVSGQDASVEAVAVDAAGAVFAGTHPYGAFDLGGMMFPSPGDAVIAKLSNAGAVLWTRDYHTGDGVYGVAVTPQGDPILVGGTTGGDLDFGTGPLLSASGIDAFVAKLSR